MDTKVSILAVLDISRFNFCKVDYYKDCRGTSSQVPPCDTHGQATINVVALIYVVRVYQSTTIALSSVNAKITIS